MTHKQIWHEIERFARNHGMGCASKDGSAANNRINKNLRTPDWQNEKN